MPQGIIISSDWAKKWKMALKKTGNLLVSNNTPVDFSDENN